MNALIVYASQFGTTRQLAEVMAEVLRVEHHVRLVPVEDSDVLDGQDVDLLLVGAPTQIKGLRLLVRPFLRNMREQGFAGVPAAAFDTRMEGPIERTGSAANGIATRLEGAGCRLAAPPESFLVADFRGPLAPGEEQRARAWALGLAEKITAPALAARE